MKGLAVAFFYLVLFAGVGALIGEKLRNRRTAGALLGLLGPIGWLLVLLFEDHRRRCPECRSPVLPGARRCAKCGAELSATAAAPG